MNKTKINDNNYPILREIFNIQSYGDATLKDYPHIGWLTFKSVSNQAFADQIQRGFTELVYDAGKSLEVDYLVYNLFTKLDKDEKFRSRCYEKASFIPDNKTGCLLLPSSKMSMFYQTVSNNMTESGRKHLYVWVVVNNNGKNQLDSFEIIEIDDNNKIYSDISRCIYTLKSTIHLASVYYILTYLIFKNFASIETVEMQKGKNRKTTAKLNKEEIELETRCSVPVTVIDSTWFRTVKGDGFTVSGHWREQYYAKTKTHQLIWIDEFSKSGYTRKARKEDY